MDLSHLMSDEAQAAARLPKEDRRQLIQKDHWYPYPRGSAVIKHMEWLLRHARIDRMPNLQLIGESMNGKTRLLKRFARELHPSTIERSNEADFRPVIYVEAPLTPSAKGLLEEILIMVNAPYSRSNSLATLREQIAVIFERIQVRVLIIDEIQHLLRGSGTKQREMRDQIKLLGNRLKIPIVAAGIPEASGAFGSDPQLSNRFHCMELPRWHMAEKEDLLYWMSIMRSWQETCPLQKPSNLLTEQIVLAVFDNTGGLFGHMINYLKTASEYALDSGEECITLTTLCKMKWVIPKEAKPGYLAV